MKVYRMQCTDGGLCGIIALCAQHGPLPYLIEATDDNDFK